MAAWWHTPGPGDFLPPDELPDLTEEEQVESAARQAAYDQRFREAALRSAPHRSVSQHAATQRHYP